MSKKATVEETKKYDCVEMKRRIQEKIYEETREMKPDEFLAYIQKQVQESRFAALFVRPGGMMPTSGRGIFQPVAMPMYVKEGEEEYTVATEQRP